MPIPSTTANAALSIVSGLVRLTGRVDQIMAEQTALRADIAFAGKVLINPPPVRSMVLDLKAHLGETENRVPDPLGDRRAELAALLEQQRPDRDDLVAWLDELLPDKLVFEVDDPSGEFAAKLASRRGAWDLDDAEIQKLTYYLDPDKDLREAKLPWQLAMSVVEILADVAVENQGLIFRDDRARPVLVAVLERFASADLRNVGPNRAFLRVVLKATLNGALDAADSLGSDKAWVNGVISALATARDKAPNGDDFVVGLVRGRGYPLLVGNLLQEGASLLSTTDAENFEAVAADVLVKAGELIQEKDGFEGFFQDYWGDLLRAGLSSVHANGNGILADADPLLRSALLASVNTLAELDDRDFLNGDTLAMVVEAAVGAVAVDPDLLDGVEEKWLREVLESTAGVVADGGIRRTFSSDGLQTLMQEVLTDFAQQPELLIRKPGLARDVAGSMLGALAAADRMRLEVVASAGVQAVLSGLADNPDLVDTKYPELIAGMAGTLAVKLDDLRLTRGEAGEIVHEIALTIAQKPTIVGLERDSFLAEVFEPVLGKLAERRGDLLSGASIRAVVGGVLEVVAADTELLADRPELVRLAVAPMLDALGRQVGDTSAPLDLRLTQVAVAGLQGVLSAIAQDPALLDTRYPNAVSKIAGVLRTHLEDRRLTHTEAEQLLLVGAEIIATNPALLATEKEDLAAKVLGAVLEKMLAEGTIQLRRSDIVDLGGEVLAILAAHGKALLGDESVEKLVARIAVVIEVGLEKSNIELGRLLDRDAVVPVLVTLLRRWALDRVPTLDIGDPQFNRLFAEIAGDVIDRVA